MLTNQTILPLIPLNGMVVFPYMVLHFDVARRRSVAALEKAMTDDQRIFLVAQSNDTKNNPTENDLYKIGTVGVIKQLLKLPGLGVRILVEGLHRAEIKEFIDGDAYSTVKVRRIPTVRVKMNQEIEATFRLAQDIFEVYCSMYPKITSEIVITAINTNNMGEFADIIAANTFHKLTDKQTILEMSNPYERLEKAVEIMTGDLEIRQMEQKIQEKVLSKLADNNREYYLREQMKVIESELGDGGTGGSEKYLERLEKLNLGDESKEHIKREINRLKNSGMHSAEAEVIRSYLDVVLDLPFNTKTKDKISIAKAEKVLNEDHYGLENVKERIIEFLAVRQLNESTHGQILCLVGPPGVGKTSIAKSIARAMGRKFTRVSLGGVRDEAEIRGHRKTYVAAMPGRIISALRIARSKNPVILFDEIDKMSNDFRGDPASAMLEVLDNEQNSAFRDHYVEVPFDLSDVFFIATANSVENIPRTLMDRMEIIEIGTYTAEEKEQIALKYLLRRQREENGIKPDQLIIQKSAIRAMIDHYTRESGVRNLERQIAKVCRKCARRLVDGESNKITVTAGNVAKFLGKPRYHSDKAIRKDEVGVATGLAWTQVGGETMPIEVNVLKGAGKIQLTGHLGSVMKESARAAISYIRMKGVDMGVDENFYKHTDIHIHVPEGATPKDGPSAGIAMATALISALAHVPVRKDVAMTGEITLRGRVLPIGGLKEKVLAAHRMGITTVIIPRENEKDIEEMPNTVQKEINFVIADNMDDVVANAFSSYPIAGGIQ
ncbi:MAG: endopeptidase La [Clostridiales bacterium]|jgi:ATP-dependent Lon protease|nr:endopeptidase La [Clostridiales bacterium]